MEEGKWNENKWKKENGRKIYGRRKMEGEIWKKEDGEPERWWIACRPLSFLLSFFPPSPWVILICDDYFVMTMMRMIINTTGQHQTVKGQNN